MSKPQSIHQTNCPQNLKREKTEVLVISVTRDKAQFPLNINIQNEAIQGLEKFFSENYNNIYLATPFGDIPLAWLNPIFNPETFQGGEDE